MAKPTSITHPWADAGTIVEPDDSKKDSGWSVSERPPYQWMNWWQNMADQWIAYLDTAFHDEHDEDGEHSESIIYRKHTVEGENCLLNPTGAAGNAWWRRKGGGACYWTPNTVGAYLYPGGVSFWQSFQSVVSTFVDESEKVELVAATQVVLSAELLSNGAAVGRVGLRIQPYDVAHNPLAVVCSITNTVLAAWQRLTAAGTLPANTAYFRVERWHTGAIGGEYAAMRRIKAEAGLAATFYEDTIGESRRVSVDHEEDGTHKDGVIAKANLVTGIDGQNMVPNPTGRQGLYGWRDLSAIMAATGEPTFDVDADGRDGDGCPEFNFTDAGAVVWEAMASDRIPVGGGKSLTLSIESFLYDIAGASGEVVAAVECYKDNAGTETALSSVCQIIIDTEELVWSLHSDTEATHADTEWVRVTLAVSNVSHANWSVRNVRLVAGTVDAVHGEPASSGRKVALFAETNGAQTIETGAGETVVFGSATFDVPAPSGRYSAGVFTADRYMIVRVSAVVLFASSANFTDGKVARLDVHKTPAGGVAAQYAMLDLFKVPSVTTESIDQCQPVLKGSALVELEAGDSINLHVQHNTGNSESINPTNDSHICIEEI